ARSARAARLPPRAPSRCPDRYRRSRLSPSPRDLRARDSCQRLTGDLHAPRFYGTSAASSLALRDPSRPVVSLTAAEGWPTRAATGTGLETQEPDIARGGVTW